MEILIEFFLLSIAFVTMGAYSARQRTGLIKSNQLKDGTHVAVSVLEEMKRELSDSATFKHRYDQSAHGPLVFEHGRTLNSVPNGVSVTITRGPAPNYLIRIRARST